MMIEPPINELLTHVDCRYTLAVEAAKRFREQVVKRLAASAGRVA